jgi:uncharacterized protein
VSSLEPAAAPGRPTADEVAALLALDPLPHEGGRFRRTYADGHSSAIYFLLGADDASAMHRLPIPEVWHHYLGDPVDLAVLHPDGRAEQLRLGADLRAGERPQVVVPARVWQGAISVGTLSLVGTTMAPPYEQADFELGDPDELARRHPAAAALIARIAARAQA